MTTLLIILVCGTLLLLAWNIAKIEELDEREEELDKYSVHLDEWANKLAEWEDILKQREGGNDERNT